MSRRRRPRSLWLMVVAVAALLLVAGTPAPASTTPGPGPEDGGGSTTAEWPILQGIVHDVGSDSFAIDVDVVWSPAVAFDVGHRTVRVSPATIFDPPSRSLENLEEGELVAVTVPDADADPAQAVDVTVVDPD